MLSFVSANKCHYPYNELLLQRVRYTVYCGITKGYLTTKLFPDWFEKYFVPESRAHCISVGLDPNCKTVLLLDSCSAHPNAELLVKDNMQGMDLPSISISFVQPCY